MSQIQNSTISKAVLFGTIGGIAGSLAMIGPKIISNIQLEMPYNVNWIVFGIVFGADKSNAFAVGLGLHILTGIIVGAIYGIITGKITKLRINKISRGIVFEDGQNKDGKSLYSLTKGNGYKKSREIIQKLKKQK